MAKSVTSHVLPLVSGEFVISLRQGATFGSIATNPSDLRPYANFVGNPDGTLVDRTFLLAQSDESISHTGLLALGTADFDPLLHMFEVL